MSTLVARFSEVIKAGKVHHLLILSGRSKSKLEEAAYTFAESWLGSKKTPDLIIRSAQGKLAFHTVASIRNLCEELSFCPFQGARRVALILDAERMLPAASNALLKSLEEPLPGTLFLLTTTSIESLLPTIRSRGQLVRIEGAPDTQTQQFSPSVEQLLSTFWTAPQVEQIYQVGKDIEKLVEDEREKRLKELKPLWESLSKVQRTDVESEFEGLMASYMQDIGRAILVRLWTTYPKDTKNDMILKNDTIFQNTFGKDGSFTKALYALEKSMPISSVLMLLTNNISS